MGKVLFMYASTIVATAGEKLFLASSVTREQQPEGKWTSQDNELKFHFYLTNGGTTEYHTNTIHTKQVKIYRGKTLHKLNNIVQFNNVH